MINTTHLQKNSEPKIEENQVLCTFQKLGQAHFGKMTRCYTTVTPRHHMLSFHRKCLSFFRNSSKQIRKMQITENFSRDCGICLFKRQKIAFYTICDQNEIFKN